MRSCSCGLLAIVLAVPALADEKPKPISVPYKLTGTNHVMVRVKLNGKGPFNFIVDTGAPALFVATKVAKKAGTEPDKNGWGDFDTFELEGGLKLEHVSGKIDDPFQLEGMNSLGIAGVELHGMIGYNLLAKYKITYDFTSDKLTLTELPGFKPANPPSFAGKGGQGGLEMIGTMMKFLGPLMGFKGPPVRKPRGYLGLELDGTTVKSVLADGPAAKAGLQTGDKIKNFGGKSVDNLDELAERAAKRGAGEEITLTIERDGSDKRITLTLGRGL